MILPSAWVTKAFLDSGSADRAFLQCADDGKGQRVARESDCADRLVSVGKIIVGEFGDRILERTRQRRHGESCGQEDCE